MRFRWLPSVRHFISKMWFYLVVIGVAVYVIAKEHEEPFNIRVVIETSGMFLLIALGLLLMAALVAVVSNTPGWVLNRLKKTFESSQKIVCNSPYPSESGPRK